MMPTTMLIIAGVLALVATVLAFIYVVPEKRREKLGAFGKFLHDTCNFKYLMVEKILQALYIFTTAAVIIFGVLMLFRTEYNYWTGDRIYLPSGEDAAAVQRQLPKGYDAETRLVAAAAEAPASGSYVINS